jgi:orotidine-5'-phosphate decarboxylase
MDHGRSADGYGLVINSSRGIIYSSKGDDYAEAAGESAKAFARMVAVR